MGNINDSYERIVEDLANDEPYLISCGCGFSSCYGEGTFPNENSGTLHGKKCPYRRAVEILKRDKDDKVTLEKLDDLGYKSCKILPSCFDIWERVEIKDSDDDDIVISFSFCNGKLDKNRTLLIIDGETHIPIHHIVTMNQLNNLYWSLSGEYLV